MRKISLSSVQRKLRPRLKDPSVPILKSFGNVTKSVTSFKSRKPPTGIRDRLSTKAYLITTPKSQSLKAKSF